MVDLCPVVKWRSENLTEKACLLTKMSRWNRYWGVWYSDDYCICFVSGLTMAATWARWSFPFETLQHVVSGGSPFPVQSRQPACFANDSRFGPCSSPELRQLWQTRAARIPDIEQFLKDFLKLHLSFFSLTTYRWVAGKHAQMRKLIMCTLTMRN